MKHIITCTFWFFIIMSIAALIFISTVLSFTFDRIVEGGWSVFEPVNSGLLFVILGLLIFLYASLIILRELRKIS